MGGPGSSLLCSWGAGLIFTTEMFNENIGGTMALSECVITAVLF